jgi:hypothetical protein
MGQLANMVLANQTNAEKVLLAYTINNMPNRNRENFRFLNMTGGIMPTYPTIVFHGGQIIARISGGTFANSAENMVVGSYDMNTGVVKIMRVFKGVQSSDFVEDIIEQAILRFQNQPMRFITYAPIVLNDLEIHNRLRSRVAMVRKPGYFEVAYDPRVEMLRALIGRGKSLGLTGLNSNVNAVNAKKRANEALKSTQNMLTTLANMKVKLNKINNVAKRVEHINKTVIKLKERVPKRRT